MRSIIRKALTKSVRIKKRDIELPPSQRLVLFLQLSIVAVICLSIIEALHILILRSFNWEVFAAITGLIGTITGVFVSKRA